jgi:hypothetical protein
MSRRLKDPILEKYLSGAMDAARVAEVERVLGESPEDAHRLADLKAEGEAFLIKHPAGAFAAKLEPEALPFWRKAVVWASLAGVLATVVVLTVMRPKPVEPENTIKGGVVLALHRRLPQGSALVGPQDVLHPGDALRFEVHGPGPGFVAVYGRDANGPVLYAPRGTTAARVEVGTALLDDAVALDAAPGPESFTAVWAPAPFELEAVRSALAQGKRVDQVVPGARLVQRLVPKAP